MELKQLKTIDINAKEWFDKVNGNSYFSGIITLNFGLKNCEYILIPFQYGYGEQYKYIASQEIKKFFNTDKKIYPLFRFCKDNKIILRTNKEENCLKRDLLK